MQDLKLGSTRRLIHLVFDDVNQSRKSEGGMMAPEPYQRVLSFLKRGASKGKTDLTFSEIRNAFSDMDQSDLLVEVHRLRDEWVLNEVSPFCYTVNKKLLKVTKAEQRRVPQEELPKEAEPVVEKKSYYERKERISPKFVAEIRAESMQYVPVIKKIILNLASDYARSALSSEYVFHSHLINKCIRQELGDVFDPEHLRLYSHYALEELTENGFIRKQDRVHWSFSLSKLEMVSESPIVH
jgi:hypothetical protein